MISIDICKMTADNAFGLAGKNSAPQTHPLMHNRRYHFVRVALVSKEKLGFQDILVLHTKACIR